jgi:hypothetical protein
MMRVLQQLFTAVSRFGWRRQPQAAAVWAAQACTAVHCEAVRHWQQVCTDVRCTDARAVCDGKGGCGAWPQLGVM